MDSFVRTRLRSFVKTYLPSTDLDSEVDDILLNYLVGVLSDMPQEQDDFDLDEFCEMMSAYISGFEEVDRAAVYEWVFETTGALQERNQEMSCPENVNLSCSSEGDLAGHVECDDACSSLSSSRSSGYDTSPTGKAPGGKAVSSRVAEKAENVCADREVCLSEKSLTDVPTKVETVVDADEGVILESYERPTRTVDETTPSSSTCDEEANAEDLALLQDMFPDLAKKQLNAVLVRCCGVLEEAVSQLLADAASALDVQSTSQQSDTVNGRASAAACDIPQQHTRRQSHSASSPEEGGKEISQVKDFVVSRYMLVDEAEDERQHHPHLVTKEKKKMVRYRDNHVVSTKGERFTVVTKKDQEDESMKKTYVSLKPLKKYRFH